MIRHVILLGLGFALATPAVAVDDPTGINPPRVEQVVFAGAEASIMMMPDGSGPSLTAAHLAGGEPVDATLRIRLVDSSNLPVSNVPAVDMWLQWSEDPGTVDGCVDYGELYTGGVFLADINTDADGWTEWSLPLFGGGHSTGSATVFIGGDRAWRLDGMFLPPVPLRVNSPDINGDLQVNLSDITMFTVNLGTASFQSDFNWDGTVNLSDIVMFTPAIGVTCP